MIPYEQKMYKFGVQIVEEMMGKVMVKVEGEEKGDCLYFEDTEGTIYTFLHWQECCENVRIEEIHGDLEDLVEAPILQAESVANSGFPGASFSDGTDGTWTFFKFATIKGSVTVRWHGSSNGYYSERVNFNTHKKGESTWGY